MPRKDRSPEENARREKIRELLQMANIGSMDDIQNLFKETIAEFIENGLEAELDDELGYSKYDYKNKDTDNSRNGHSSTTLRTSFGDVEVSVPRDRKGEFEPQVLKKNQTSISQDIEEKILSMYVKGMTTSDIEAHIQDIYGISVSDSTVSRITDKILPIAKEWQQRPLEPIYVKAKEGYEKAYQKFVDMGGTALLRTEATELIYDDDGTIVGVRAQADDGTEYSVMAQCVILATGGFGGNDEMVEQYTPGGSDWIYYGWQGNDGAGIQMALDAGANPYHMDAYPMSHQRMGAEFVTVFDVQQTETGELWSPNDLAVVLAVNDDGVYVTSDGTPFKTEDIHSSMGGFSGSMASYYLGSRYYVVYSATQLEAYANSGIADTTMGFQNTGEGVPAGYALGDWVDTVLEYAASRGWAWKVSSLAEGDAAIGLPEGTLEAAYAADATELNRAGDTYYYVMACTGLSISSCGGVEVNEKMQAVRTDGSAIENLFVVGNDSFGNIMSTGAEYSIGGDAGMWCMGSADVAAKTAIEMVTAQ